MTRANIRRGVLVAAVVLMPGLSFGAATPAQKCAAAKRAAAVKATAAKTKCYQKATFAGTTVDTDCLLAADEKFNNTIAKVEAKGGCAVTGDASTIAGAVESCVESFGALTPSSDCTLPSTCTAGHACVSLVDNSAQNVFGLRLSQLTLTQPAGLASGLLSSIIGGNVLPNIASCNLHGAAYFNWLLEADKAAHTIRIGGAVPVADPTQGYSFAAGTTFGFSLAPATTSLSLTGSGTFQTTATDVTLPIYLDGTGVSSIVLPLSGLTVEGQLSSDQNCVGSYNSAGLDPINNCAADAGHPTFLEEGVIHGYITLEDADAVLVGVLHQSLCVLLTGDSDGGNPAHCTRSMGAIAYTGDYCSTTNSAGGCGDAMEFAGTFAASAVKINP